jgi:hypothetical protein
MPRYSYRIWRRSNFFYHVLIIWSPVISNSRDYPTIRDRFDVASCGCVWDGGFKRTTPLAAPQQLGTKQYAANGQKGWEAMAD